LGGGWRGSGGRSVGGGRGSMERSEIDHRTMVIHRLGSVYSQVTRLRLFGAGLCRAAYGALGAFRGPISLAA